MKTDYDRAGKVIGLAMKIHSPLGAGILESVCPKAWPPRGKRSARGSILAMSVWNSKRSFAGQNRHSILRLPVILSK